MAAASACTRTQAWRLSDEQRPSGLYERGKLFFPKQDFQVDPGRLAFGQERLGNHAPADGDGRSRHRQRRRAHAAISRPAHPCARREGSRTQRAERGRTRHEAVHCRNAHRHDGLGRLSGTGTAGQISGVEVAGKTGTAETGVAGRNTTWFVAFAPAENARIAVAVVLENQTGTGGSTAAPLACGRS